MSASNQLRAVANGEAKTSEPANFPKMLEAYKGEIARALPRHLNPDQMLRVAITAFRMTPKLKECEPASLFACIVQASQLGLRPNMLGECYLIPYNNRQKKTTECQLQIGYQGMLELVRRSGQIGSVLVQLVYENDDYQVRFGTDPGITHNPLLTGDRGEIVLGYGVANFKNGGQHVEVMTREEINRIRDRSQNVISAKKYNKKTPWDTDYEEMARKTVARRLCKYLPKSSELATAIALSDAADMNVQTLDMDTAIENSFVMPAIDHDDDQIDNGTTEETDAIAPAEPVDTPAQTVKSGGQPAPTYAAVRDQLQNASSVKELKAAAARIQQIEDAEQRKELREIATKLGAK